jgi:hypothetical protein
VWRIQNVYPGSQIPDPDFYSSRIPDPGFRIPDPKTVTKDRGEKKICQTIFCSHKFHKTEYYFILDMLKKKNWPNFPRIIEDFTQKIVTKPSKIWVWGPGSGKNLFRIQGSKRHRIPVPNPQHWIFYMILTGVSQCSFLDFFADFKPAANSQFGIILLNF